MAKKTAEKEMSVSKSGKQSLSYLVKEFIDDHIYSIDLDADYQRDKVWERADQELLLNSILRNIDIPKMYLAQITEKRGQFTYECIDGKQRMLSLLNFFKPDDDEKNPLSVSVEGKKYTYLQLKRDLPTLAKQIEGYQLDFVIYKEEDLDDEFVREIFRRLQLGVRLNSGELLNSQMGTIRNFVYKENGSAGPFLRKTKLSEKRFSRQFTLAQICLNSFNRDPKTGDFDRARLRDIEDFFGRNSSIEKDDERLDRIRNVLNLMDKNFDSLAEKISSRAVAVSAYFFVEDLYLKGEVDSVAKFVEFFVKFLEEVKRNMKLLSDYKEPQNKFILEDFQKYISQASVEPYSIRRRNEFLKIAFQYYLDPKTKGKIIANK